MSAVLERLFHEHRAYARALSLSIARRLPPQISREELIQLGELGLWQAARKFDPNHGALFTTYAYPRVRGAVFDGLRKMVDLPPALRRELTRMNASDDLVASTVPTGLPQDGEAAARLFVNTLECLGAVYVASQLGPEDAQALAAVDPTSAAEAAGTHDLLQRLRLEIRRLPERQQQVVELLYQRQLSTTECARILGINKAQVSRDHAKAIARFRKALGENDRKDAG